MWFLIFAGVLIAYSPALNGGVLWDDFGHITVPELRSLHGLWRIWFELGATQQYYPLLHSAFWAEHRLWGDAVLGYHLANVALHSLASFLVVLLLRRLAVPGALLAGLIFALHPVAVESVAWISEQKNTLSAVFYLGAALVYLDFDEPRPRSRHLLALTLFVLALLTKTVTATLPAALLVVLWWKRGRLSWKRDVIPLVPWFAAAAAGGLLTAWFEHELIGARGPEFELSLAQRFLLAGRAIWFYLGKLIWPTNLAFIYPRWTIDPFALSQYIFPAAVVALAIGLGVLAKRIRAPLAGFLFFCGTLFPVLGFVDVYPFRFSYVADHFQYLASLGVIVPVASGLASAVGARTQAVRRSAQLVSVAVLAVLGVLTWRQSAMYQDAETLYRSTISRNPDCWMCYLNLGTEHAARNRFAEAIDAYEGALRARPGYPDAKRNLVLAHMKLGDASADVPSRSGEAIAHYEAVLRIEPAHFRAHYNLGTVLMDVPDREAEAISHLEAAVRIQPNSPEARVNLGVALADMPVRSHEAIEHLELALAQRPDLASIRELLAQLSERGKEESKK